jgi:hypothetical protein
MERTYRCKNCSADVYSGCLCGCCGYRHVPGERKAKTAADRVAQLTAELAEARHEVANHLLRTAKVEFERDAAQAEAAAIRTRATCMCKDYPHDARCPLGSNAGRDLAARVTLLEAVAEAARNLSYHYHFETMGRLRNALAALDKESK